MKTLTPVQSEGETQGLHELIFGSLYDHGRGIVVPCDATGKVDIDSLSERMRAAYFGARAMIGREYAYPTVHVAH